MLVLSVLTLLAWMPPGWARPRLDQVTLQLKWTHSFQFAGYYAALEQGYFRDAGLDVQLKEAGPGVDPVQRVLAGQAQYGVGTSSLLLARQAGQPVVVLAVVFQHSPLVILTRQTGPTRTVHDLIDRTLMLEPLSEELLAYLQREGIPPARIKRVPHSQSYQELLAGKVDAISAYTTHEPLLMEAAGIPYHAYTPRAAGIDFYGDNLFTTDDELRAHPQRAAAFREASLKGWAYAMAHPEHVIAWIRQKYAPALPEAFLQRQVMQMRALMLPDLVEVGYMNEGRWRHIADTYADLGLLPRDVAIAPLLYDVQPRVDRSWLFGLVAVSLLGGATVAYITWMNRRLRRALARSREATAALQDNEARMRHMAQHDPLTGLPNRALFSDRLQQALRAAARDGHSAAVMFVDLDQFKPINDVHGHAVGDAVLQTLAGRLVSCVRASDTVARIGGDEFVVLLRNVDGPEGALAVAEKIRGSVREPVRLADRAIQCTVSVGAALYPQHGSDDVTLCHHADLAMYAAKEAGRDRCRMYSAADGVSP